MNLKYPVSQHLRQMNVEISSRRLPPEVGFERRLPPGLGVLVHTCHHQLPQKEERSFRSLVENSIDCWLRYLKKLLASLQFDNNRTLAVTILPAKM